MILVQNHKSALNKQWYTNDRNVVKVLMYVKN